MRFFSFILVAAAATAPAAEPAPKFDAKTFAAEFMTARSKAMSAAKTVPGEQPPFVALRPMLETAWQNADAATADGKAVRKMVVTYLALYPQEPRAKELLAEALKDVPPVEAAGVRLSMVSTLDRLAGNPATPRADVPKLLAEAAETLDRVEKDLAGADDAKSEQVRKRAKAMRDTVTRLAPGQPAPDVELKNIAGKAVKLSDLRGKIVVLDVWHTGCSPCVAMIPHETEMVARLKGLPFELVSVSFDETKQDLEDFLKATPMPWTHWYNGRDGAMTEAYRISHFPTMFVIDPKGVIRFKEVRDHRLDEAVDALLTEAGVPAARLVAKKFEPSSRAEKIAALRAEFQKKNMDAMKSLSDGPLSKLPLGERQKAYESALANMADFAPRAFALADPADDTSMQALAFVAMTGRESPEGTEAFRRLAERFAAHPGIGKLLDSPTANRANVRPFAERVVAVHPDRTTRAGAALLLANLAVRAAEYADTPAAAVAAQTEAAGLLQRVIDDFAGVKLGKQGTADETAKGLLPDVTAFGVGSRFPDLAGETVEGKPARLSDLRGKVVVFDVWATWCGPCKAMIPHERELVKRLDGKPFALVSVSADDEKGTLTEFLKETDMPWTHWWGGADGKKLIKELHVRHYPTIYVLDADGVIRYKGVRGAKMDAAVDELLKEMEAKGKAAAR
jgi:thiol-disulfide isomerase/thioredoxin